MSIYIHRNRALPRKQSVVDLRPAQTVADFQPLAVIGVLYAIIPGGVSV